MRWTCWTLLVGGGAVGGCGEKDESDGGESCIGGDKLSSGCGNALAAEGRLPDEEDLCVPDGIDLPNRTRLCAVAFAEEDGEEVLVVVDTPAMLVLVEEELVVAAMLISSSILIIVA